MLESWSNIIKQKTKKTERQRCSAVLGVSPMSDCIKRGQSVLKAQRLLSNSWIGWEAHTDSLSSVWELSLIRIDFIELT
ncbi:hypothetical protein BJP34_11085 [Moorena producens PAL-8-15-08-1]|uniref:Uncharacterized protein n=1 Tax=Moorena producens PAL-8-15-08-1 TaxID=1458985 RepID=A0A1D8TQS3_9CYAN|nr:hypothetical protein BJP34_11085 [Moorena producens PAL-8-15-08-1]